MFKNNPRIKKFIVGDVASHGKPNYKFEIHMQCPFDHLEAKNDRAKATFG